MVSIRPQPFQELSYLFEMFTIVRIHFRELQDILVTKPEVAFAFGGGGGNEHIELPDDSLIADRDYTGFDRDWAHALIRRANSFESSLLGLGHLVFPTSDRDAARDHRIGCRGDCFVLASAPLEWATAIRRLLRGYI